jgi:hypothetical protein
MITGLRIPPLPTRLHGEIGVDPETVVGWTTGTGMLIGSGVAMAIGVINGTGVLVGAGVLVGTAVGVPLGWTGVGVLVGNWLPEDR